MPQLSRIEAHAQFAISLAIDRLKYPRYDP
jgi:hypothetical protein